MVKKLEEHFETMSDLNGGKKILLDIYADMHWVMR